MRHKSTDTAIEKIIGGNVKRRRLLLGLSQAALGEQVGVTYQQIAKFEDGSNRISASRLLAFANILGCAVADLLLGVAEQLPSAPEQLDQADARLLRNVKKLTPSMQSAVGELTVALAKEVSQNLSKEKPNE